MKLKLTDVLADALRETLPAPLVKIIRGYLVFSPAFAATPALLSQLAIGVNKYSDYCSGIAVSPYNSTVWIASGTTMQLFSDEGKLVRHARQGKWRPCGIAFATNGEAYVADCRACCVVVCAPDGSFVRKIGRKGRQKAQFYQPESVAVHSKQRLLFVADGHNHRVQVLKLDGSFVRSWGSKGYGEGQFSFPHAIALSAAGEIAVTDSGNNRVQVCAGACLLFV